MAYRALDWYDVPLYYDIVFESRTQDESNFLEDLYAAYAPTRSRRVLEPACGSGRLVAELAARGYRVTGFDISAPMLDFARARLERAGDDAALLEAPMQSFQLRRRFDLAHCFVSTFKYLLTEDDARAHLQRVADALKPGAIYALGFHLTDYDTPEIDRERWVGTRGAVRVVCNIQSWPPDRKRRIERVRSRLVVSRGDDVRRYETHWQFRTYSARQFRSLLAKVPDFEHIATHDFDYDAGREVEFGVGQLDNVVILRKRAR